MFQIAQATAEKLFYVDARVCRLEHLLKFPKRIKKPL